AAHAVEHARAVMQAVGEHMDLCLFPWDEVAIHPDEVGRVHGFALLYRLSSTALLARSVLASPPRSGVRRPASRARCTADSTAAASAAKPSPCSSIIAADRNI